MNPILNSNLSTETKQHELTFLLTMLILMVIQFCIFYFGIPRLANGFVDKATDTSGSGIEVSQLIIT